VISPSASSRLAATTVDALWGVGPVTPAKLRSRGIERLTDIRGVDPQLLRETVGSTCRLAASARARRRRSPGRANRPTKSSGSESTIQRISAISRSFAAKR